MPDIIHSTAPDSELDQWQAAGSAVRIEYSREVMEALRLAAVDGFNRLAHGGVEIGGVLFGVRDGDAVKILAHRELACEYAFGPSFTLSENDRRALESLLASPQTDDDELSGMQPIGWYHSHTRSEILLSEKDLEFFHEYFPGAWQIALVLRPHRFDPVRAGFFFREPDGSVYSVSSRFEFSIPSRGRNPGMGLPGDRAPDNMGATAHLGVAEPALLSASLQVIPDGSGSEWRSEPEPHRIRASRGATRYGRRFWVWSAVAVAVALAAVLFWAGRSRRSTEVSLRAVDVGGQLRIDWNRNSRTIQQSESGALEIADGSMQVHDELSPEHLREGNITYLRTTGSVLVRLLVRGRDGSTLTEMTRFLGPPVVAAGPVGAGSADQSAKENGPKVDPAQAAPVTEERDREAQGEEPAERLSKQTSRMGRVQRGRIQRGRVQPGRIQRGGVQPGPVQRGRVQPGPVQRGRVQRGPAQRGAVQRGRVRTESARRASATSAPERRRLVVSPSVVARPPDLLLPSPPLIAANTAAPAATFIPRLPAPVPPKHGDQGPPPKLVYKGPSAGKIIWTGKLARSGTIQIFGNRASQGQITGALPGAPVRVHVFPAEMTQEGLRIFTANPKSIGAPEAPGAQNGWNRTVYVLNPRKAGEIGIVEVPGLQNAWNRLILRAERGDHAIIVLQWERVPADPSIHVAGEQ